MEDIKLKKTVVSILLTGIMALMGISTGYSESITEIINSSTPNVIPPDRVPDRVAEPLVIEKNPVSLQPTKTSSQLRYYAVQIGVFLKETNAENKITQLTESGYYPYLFQSLNSKNQTVYAVRIGKFDDYQAATDELLKIKTNFRGSALITYFDSLTPVSTATVTSQPAMAEPEATPEIVFPESSLPDPTGSETTESATLESLQEKILRLENAMKSFQDDSDIRKNLVITEAEEKEEEEDILEAAGREYVLTEAGNIRFSYGFHYGYNEYDAIKESVRVEDVADHTISNSFGVSYGLKDNISVGLNIPFIYKYHRVGTVDSMDVNDLGNLGLNWQYQPLKSSTDLPTIIINGSFSIPVGRSPYEIQYGNELSTSSGIYTAGLGVSVSQVSDPVVVFSSLSISYPLTLTGINQKRPEGTLMEVDQGMGIGLGVGMGYALSYKLNLNVSFGYSYSFESKYTYKDNISASSGTGASANLNLGIGYKLSRKQNLNFRIGLPVTESRQFTFSFYTPVEFEL